MHATRDLTQGSLWKNIFLFSVPLILSNLLQVLFNMSDLAVVGNFAQNGAQALGCVGSTSNLVFLFTGVLMGLGSGVNVLTARYYGAREPDEVEKTVHTAAVVCALAGVLLMAVCLLLSAPVLRLLGTKDVLFDGALLYFRIVSLGLPALAIYNFGCGVFSAVGDTRTPLRFMMLSGIVNLLLNLIFVIAFRWDVEGVATATVLSQYLSAVLVVIKLLRSGEWHALRLRRLRIVPDKAKMMLAIGVPTAMQNAIFQVANLFIQGGVNTFSPTVVEGNSVADQPNGIVFCMLDAFYVACTSFMSQNYGAGKRDRVLKSYRVSLTYACGTALLLSGLLALFGRPFLSLFNRDPAVLDAGMYRLNVMCCCYVFAAVMDCTIAASRGLGKTFVPTVIVVVGSCLFRIAWVYTVFAYFHTMISLYALYLFSWVLTGAAEIVYFRRVWKKLFPATNSSLQTGEYIVK
ncbi:MAG: MATE family efflux transporter [Oscillospiraceae bacterium]|nr:MATE family efflux transporter [Oscillospiraceae bacterium]